MITGAYVADNGRVLCAQILHCMSALSDFLRGSAPKPVEVPQEKDPVQEEKVSLSPSPMAINVEEKKPNCRSFTLWGKYVSEMYPGSKLWTCMKN